MRCLHACLYSQLLMYITRIKANGCHCCFPSKTCTVPSTAGDSTIITHMEVGKPCLSLVPRAEAAQ